MAAVHFRKLNISVRAAIIAALTLLLVLLTGCGESEDPGLTAERRMVSEGVEILRSGTPVQRDSVIRSFYTMEHPELLHQYLRDKDIGVQIGMVSAIGYHKEQSAAPELNSLLREVDDYLLQETIIYAIGEIRDTSSVGVLTDLVRDESVNRDLRLSIPITLASFGGTPAGDRVEKTFIELLRKYRDDPELCSYVAVGILEMLGPGNQERFREHLPLLKSLADKRKQEAGEDGIWTNLNLTIQELERYAQSPAS